MKLNENEKLYFFLLYRSYAMWSSANDFEFSRFIWRFDGAMKLGRCGAQWKGFLFHLGMNELIG